MWHPLFYALNVLVGESRRDGGRDYSSLEKWPVHSFFGESGPHPLENLIGIRIPSSRQVEVHRKCKSKHMLDTLNPQPA